MAAVQRQREAVGDEAEAVELTLLCHADQRTQWQSADLPHLSLGQPLLAQLPLCLAVRDSRSFVLLGVGLRLLMWHSYRSQWLLRGFLVSLYSSQERPRAFTDAHERPTRSWFAFAPLTPEVIKADLGLSQAQIGNSNIVALTATMGLRLVLGPVVDRKWAFLALGRVELTLSLQGTDLVRSWQLSSSSAPFHLASPGPYRAPRACVS